MASPVWQRAFGAEYFELTIHIQNSRCMLWSFNPRRMDGCVYDGGEVLGLSI